MEEASGFELKVSELKHLTMTLDNISIYISVSRIVEVVCVASCNLYGHCRIWGSHKYITSWPPAERLKGAGGRHRGWPVHARIGNRPWAIGAGPRQHAISNRFWRKATGNRQHARQ